MQLMNHLKLRRQKVLRGFIISLHMWQIQPLELSKYTRHFHAIYRFKVYKVRGYNGLQRALAIVFLST